MTAAIHFKKDAKRVATIRNKIMVRMESALALWIMTAEKKDIKLDMNVICTNTRTLYQTDSNDIYDREEEEDVDTWQSMTAVFLVASSFNAGKGWF